MGLFNEVVHTCPDCGGEILNQTKSGSSSMRRFSQNLVPVEELAALDSQVYCDGCGSAFIVSGSTHVALSLVPFSVVE